MLFSFFFSFRLDVTDSAVCVYMNFSYVLTRAVDCLVSVTGVREQHANDARVPIDDISRLSSAGQRHLRSVCHWRPF